MNRVAICIPTYNQGAYLEGAVRSALAQTVPCEIWVSDDASTDQTPEVMARLKEEFPQIIAHRQAMNLGMSGNPRWIVRQPACEFVVKLDSDDELYPDYVETLVSALDEYPRAGYAHPAVEEISSAGARRRLRLLARDTGFQPAEDSLRASISGYRVAANICIFRTAALKEVDYYRSDLTFADDWDLAVRLADAGWGNVHVRRLLAKYRVWDTAGGERARRKLAEVEGCRRVFEESLLPAFSRRNWSLESIRNVRERMALRHAGALRSPLFSPGERKELMGALKNLGDSPRLRWKFRWIRTPLASLFLLRQEIVSTVRDWSKRIVFAPRR